MVRRVLVPGLLEIDDDYTQIGSTVSALRVTSMTTAQRLALGNLIEGSLVFDSDFDSLYIYSSGVWSAVGGGGGGPHTHPLADITDEGALASLSSVDTAQIVNNAVTLVKLADLATDTVIGRATAGTGDPEALACTAAGRALLDDTDAAAQRATLGLAAVASSGSATDLSTGVLPDARMPNLTGDVTTVEGAVATTITDDAVTNAKLANMAANTIKGNNTGGAADPLDLTAAQVTAILDAFTSALKGLVPASGGGTSNFLRADGAWASPGAGSGPVSVYALTADALANLTTVGVEIAGLQAGAIASGTYAFQYFIVGRAAATSTGLKFGINFTGTTTRFRASMRQVGTGTSAVTGSGDDANTAAQIVEGFTARVLSTIAPNLGPTLGVAAASQDVQLIIEGTIAVSTSGDLEIWHASEVAASSQVIADSCLILTKVA